LAEETRAAIAAEAELATVFNGLYDIFGIVLLTSIPLPHCA
jgi:hypothetical protein